MKKLSIAILLVVVCSAAALAWDFDVKVSPDSVTIASGERANFTLTITHNSNHTERFSIYSPDVDWDVPATVVDVAPGEQGQAYLAIKQYNDRLNPGFYLVNVHIRPNSEDVLVKRAALIALRGKGTAQYLPSLRLTPKMAAVVDPRIGTNLVVTLTNFNPLNLSDVTLLIRSSLLNTDVKTTLIGLETKQVSVPVSYGPGVGPQDDSVKVTALVRVDNQTYHFDGVPAQYSVIEYGEIAAAESTAGGWLSSTKTIAFTNTGNAAKTQTFTVSKPWLSGMFMSTQPSARVVADDKGRGFAFDIALEAGASTSVAITTDWTPLVIIIVVIILAIIIYYIGRSPLVVKKSAVVIATDSEGLTDVKVLIEIRNRSGNVIKNVKLLDKIPRIVHLTEERGVGTLRPAEIVRHDQSGTLLRWNIHELDRFEERVVSYKIRSKLSILGRLHLPVAIVKFEKKPGRVRSTKSNVSQIGFGS
jgi:hypothetical protein